MANYNTSDVKEKIALPFSIRAQIEQENYLKYLIKSRILIMLSIILTAGILTAFLKYYGKLGLDLGWMMVPWLTMLFLIQCFPSRTKKIKGIEKTIEKQKILIAQGRYIEACKTWMTMDVHVELERELEKHDMKLYP